MNRAPWILALLLAAWAQTSTAQITASATDVARSVSAPVPGPGSPRGAIPGFVYTGRPIDGHEMRWAYHPAVNHVFSGSPAQAVGLPAGDAILRVTGREGTGMTASDNHHLGKTYTLLVQRGMREVEITFTLVEATWPLSEWTPPAGLYSAP